MLTVAFTGHRPNKLGGYYENPIRQWVRGKLWSALCDLRPDRALVGMALGFDTDAANACVAMRIPFVAAVPCLGQDSRWPDRSRAEYTRLLTQAESVVLVSQHGYTPRKMQVRNEWMVDRADVLLAVWDGSKGGTANCVEYARQKGVQVLRLDPTDFDVFPASNFRAE